MVVLGFTKEQWEILQKAYDLEPAMSCAYTLRREIVERPSDGSGDRIMRRIHDYKSMSENGLLIDAGKSMGYSRFCAVNSVGTRNLVGLTMVCFLLSFQTLPGRTPRAYRPHDVHVDRNGRASD